MDAPTPGLCPPSWPIRAPDRGCGGVQRWRVGRGAAKSEDQPWVIHSVILLEPFSFLIALVNCVVVATDKLLTSTGRLKPALLAHVLGAMVGENLAVYDAPKQTRSALLYWRLPEEWAEVLHEWVRTYL